MLLITKKNINKLIVELDFQISIRIDSVWLCLFFNLQQDDMACWD